MDRSFLRSWRSRGIESDIDPSAFGKFAIEAKIVTEGIKYLNCALMVSSQNRKSLSPPNFLPAQQP